jgi:aminoglycoside phosphotransferase (APT) family kinase protein
MPAAEVDVTPDLVRRLLAGQHPDLAGLPVTVLANGWDNLSCRLGDQLLVRLPRRAVAAELVRNEQRWLPVLAPRLPLAVPVPVRTGVPAMGYPWYWSIVPYLPGLVAAACPPADPAETASVLGGFLGALHVPAPPEAPANPVRGVPLASRDGAFTARVRQLGGAIDGTAAMRAWQVAVAAPPWDRPPVWLHGDLHPANILVSEGRISGVIDFGDITSGDPATDLAVAWMLLPGHCHETFLAAYGEAGGPPPGASTRARARGWALGLAVATLARSADTPLMTSVARTTLGAVLGGQ